jgi:competence protein ComEA
VQRIVEARTQAPFRSLDDLDARVRGIGPATIAALRPHLRIELSAAPPDSPLPAPRVARNAR